MAHNIIDLTDSQFNEIITQHPVALVDFWAPWCTPCNALGPVINQLAMLYTGKVAVCKLNIDDNPEMAVKYGIRSIPTLLIFHNAEEVDRFGPLPLYEIQKKLNKYLPNFIA